MYCETFFAQTLRNLFLVVRLTDHVIIITSVDKIRKLFDVIKYSERGSNAYTKETATFMIVDFLEDCERG